MSVLVNAGGEDWMTLMKMAAKYHPYLISLQRRLFTTLFLDPRWTLRVRA